MPGFGYSWRPIVVADWAPYRQGRWVWEDWYGWTWVSYEPWGWAPYHYGRWFYQPVFGWCWYPGAVGVRHYWSPALVAFFGFGDSEVSVGFGNIGWVPLAPYEVLHPWWGRGFYGGPEYVDRSINITNVNVANVYSNARVNNGFTAVGNADFRSGRFNNFVHASGDQLQRAGTARGPIPVTPDRAHLAFSDRQTAFVPQRANSNMRFFTRQTPNPAPSASFADQRQRLAQINRSFEPVVANRGRLGQPIGLGGFPGGQAPARNEISGSQRLDNQGRGAVDRGRTNEPNTAGGLQRQAPAMTNDGGGWQRFGDARSGQLVPRTEQVAPSNNRGWGRFSEPSGGPRSETIQPQRQEFRNQPLTPGGLQRQAPAMRNDGGGWQRFGDGRSGQLVPRTEQVAPSNNRSWGRFSEPSGGPRSETIQPQRQEFRNQPLTPGGLQRQAPAMRNDGGGWQRFGDARSGQLVPRTEQVAPSNNRGWGHFSEPSGGPRSETVQPPRQEFRRQESTRQEFRDQPPAFDGGDARPRIQAPQPERLRIAPPVVRDRSFADSGGFNGPRDGGGFGGPKGGGFGFSAPRSEPRAPSGGEMRAPSRGGSRNNDGGGEGNRGNRQ